MFAEEYIWHEVDDSNTWIYCADEDWDGDGSEDRESIYDWATVVYESDPGSGLWGAWWTSAENQMCFGEGDFFTSDEAREHIESVREEYE